MPDNPPVRRLSDWNPELLRDIADEYETPTYVIDLQRVRANASRLRAAFPEAAIAYAVKANTSAAVLETLRETGVGAECASAGEVMRVLDAGYAGEDIRYTAVNPPDRDLEYVVNVAEEHDPVVTVGAEDTLMRLIERGYDGRFCVRVNPGVGAGHHEKVATGAEPKFGVPYDRAHEVAAAAAAAGDLVGLHAHAGSGISAEELSDHRELVERMAAIGREIGVDHPLEFICVGGGFGVPYREEEPPLDLTRVADATREAFAEAPDGIQLAIEPGRYFVADAGVLLTTVNTVKETPDTTTVGIDAGMTTLARPALYDAYHEVRSLEPARPARETRRVELAGPVCESADVLGRDRTLPDPSRGDVLAVGNAGAYGYEMASTYNSRPRPAVVALDGGEVRPAMGRERLAELTRLEVW